MKEESLTGLVDKALKHLEWAKSELYTAKEYLPICDTSSGEHIDAAESYMNDCEDYIKQIKHSHSSSEEDSADSKVKAFSRMLTRQKTVQEKYSEA